MNPENEIVNIELTERERYDMELVLRLAINERENDNYIAEIRESHGNKNMGKEIDKNNEIISKLTSLLEKFKK